MLIRLSKSCAFALLLLGLAPGRASAQAPAPAAARPAEPPNVVAVPERADDAAATSELRRAFAAQAAALARLEAREAERTAHEREPKLSAVRLTGFLQVDWVAYQQASQDEVDFATGTPLNQNRFTLRRGHLRLDAGQRALSAALEVDANTIHGAELRPIDAEVSFRWPERDEPRCPRLTVSAGLMKIPFGREVPEADFVRPFLERSTALRALFPGSYDLGARIQAAYRFAVLTVAVMNGHPIGDRVFPALAPARHKELLGRLGVTSLLLPKVGLKVGVSADVGTGFHEGTPTTKDALVWRDDNGDGVVQATEVQVIAGSAATPSQTFQRFAVGADGELSVRWAPHGELVVSAEIVTGQNLDRGLEPADPVARGRDLREIGWYVGATQELCSWAALGVRYDEYDPDGDAREQQAAQIVPRDRSYRTLALLALLRYEEGRLSFEYDRNGNALGRQANGAPTTLANDAFTVRAQVTF